MSAKLKAILIFQLLTQLLHAQLNNNISYIGLKLSKKKLDIDTISFNKVIVLDNRLDSTFFFTELTGVFPPHRLSIDSNESLLITKTIEYEIRKYPTRDQTLLLNIDQLRIPNVMRILRKGGQGVTDLRGHIYISISLYFKTEENLYNKRAQIIKKYKTYGEINETLTDILNNLIEIASYSGRKDVPKKINKFIRDSALIYYNDNLNIPLDSLKINVKNKWAKYFINYADVIPDGGYKSFWDFRENTILPMNAQLSFDNKDSVYRLINFNHNLEEYPWAIYNKGCFYIQLYKDSYVKAYRFKNGIQFYVPTTYPDMYTLLSIEEGFGGDYINSQWANGCVSCDFSRILGTDNSLRRKKNKLKISKQTAVLPQANYRNCYIDMDTGDIVF